MSRSLSYRALPLLSVTLLAAAPSIASGQTLASHDEPAFPRLGEAAFLSLNTVVGGITAGLWQELSGGSFKDGFLGGAFGGSVVYAGKRVAAESFAGAGLLGRQVAAAGSSMVRNAAAARPVLDSLMVAVGPLRLYVGSREPNEPRFEVNLRDVYWTTYGLAADRLELDLGESLSSGAVVFRSTRTLADSENRRVAGTATGGAVFLSPRGREETRRILAHERTHVLQLDFLYHVASRPLEDHLASNLPGHGFVRHVDYDIVVPVLQWSLGAAGWTDRIAPPFEAEAEFLEER